MIYGFNSDSHASFQRPTFVTQHACTDNQPFQHRNLTRYRSLRPSKRRPKLAQLRLQRRDARITARRACRLRLNQDPRSHAHLYLLMLCPVPESGKGPHEPLRFWPRRRPRMKLPRLGRARIQEHFEARASRHDGHKHLHTVHRSVMTLDTKPGLDKLIWTANHKIGAGHRRPWTNPHKEEDSAR